MSLKIALAEEEDSFSVLPGIGFALTAGDLEIFKLLCLNAACCCAVSTSVP